MRPVVGAVCAIALLVAGCGTSSSALPDAKRPKVVATAYPLFEAASTVGGARVHASNLLPLDPFAPIAPDKAERLRTASLAIVLGKGVQPEVDKVVAERTGPTLTVLDHFDPDVLEPDGQLDPYVWENPQNMAKIVELVRLELTAMDPAGGSVFFRDAARYSGMLATIDKNYTRTIATCKRRDLVTEDARYGHLAKRYDLQQVVVTDGPARPGVQSLREVVDRLHPSTIFAGTLPEVGTARRLIDVYGTKVAVLDPMVAQTDQARRGGASYGAVMALNLDAIRWALDCAAKTPRGK